MTDNRTTELLPCPFCGSRAHLYGDDYWFYWVECICCYCKVGYEETTEQGIGHVDSGRFKTEAEAIAAWNTRAATTDTEFARAVHDGNLWRRVKGHIQCKTCGLNIESVIPLDGCNKRAIKFCPNCGSKVVNV